jgi:hypothetical protein
MNFNSAPLGDRPVNYAAIGVAALSAFMLSSLYYSPAVLGNVWRAVDPAAASIQFSPWKPLLELSRTVGITFVIARLLSILGACDVLRAVTLALWMWAGFSVLMWVGAIMWEGTPLQVAAIHCGDWLLKTLLIAVILGAWPDRSAQ